MWPWSGLIILRLFSKATYSQWRLLLPVRFKLIKSIDGNSSRKTLVMLLWDRSRICSFLSSATIGLMSGQSRPLLANLKCDKFGSSTEKSLQGKRSLVQPLLVAAEYQKLVRFRFWANRASGKTLDPLHLSFSHRISSTKMTLLKRSSGIGPNWFPEKSIFRICEAPRVRFSAMP